jgi:hypothetical protein
VKEAVNAATEVMSVKHVIYEINLSLSVLLVVEALHACSTTFLRQCLQQFH